MQKYINLCLLLHSIGKKSSLELQSKAVLNNNMFFTQEIVDGFTG